MTTPPLRERLRARVSASRRTLADVGVAVLVAASAAMGGLVLDNALPVGAAPVTFSALRWAFMIAFLVGLILCVAYRRRVYQGTGTLYSLSFLDETMLDYHEQAQSDAASGHMAVRLLGRRVDVLGRERDGAVDVVQPRQELSRALESAMNQDRDDTGYAVAPVLLWPAALAIGASLTRTDRIRFLDYDKKTTTEFRLRNKEFERVAIRTKPDHIVPEPTGDRRGVLLSFTPAAAKFDIDRRCGEFGVSELALLDPQPHVQGRLLTGPELARLADDLAGHLADIKRTTRNRELVIVAFLPKTVALLTGWYLSRQQVRFFAGTYLMHYLQPPDDRFVAMRVHPSQPTAFPSPWSEASPPSSVTGHSPLRRV
ncbi:MAG TPA: hypothetical protein VIY28_03345 [Pseudonocardiaceae bacterium]